MTLNGLIYSDSISGMCTRLDCVALLFPVASMRVIHAMIVGQVLKVLFILCSLLGLDYPFLAVLGSPELYLEVLVGLLPILSFTPCPVS